MLLVIFLWITLCSFFVFLSYNTVPITNKKNTIFDILKFTLERQQFSRRDCEHIQVPCFVANDCADICLYPDGYTCTNGICSKLSINTLDDKPQCNTKHGIISMLVGDEALGSVNWQCISLYKQIWTDSDRLVKHVCEGGIMNIDLTKISFTPLACQCPENTSLIFKDFDAFNQPVPRCVKHDRLFPDYQKPAKWLLKTK